MPDELLPFVESVLTLGFFSAFFRLWPRIGTKLALRYLGTDTPLPTRSDAGNVTETLATVRRAIARGARVFPGTTCLSRSVSAASMLRRRGIAPTMRLSVESTTVRDFTAHAWLECAGLVVVGPVGRGPSITKPVEHR